MQDDHDVTYWPELGGIGSAQTLIPHPHGKIKKAKRRPIGFAIPKRAKA